MDSSDRERLATAPLNELVSGALQPDHEWFLSELHHQIELAVRIESENSEHLEVPRGLSEHLQSMRESLSNHLEREELIVFPLILTGRALQAQEAIKGLEFDHRDFEDAIRRTRQLTADLRPPADASPDWKELYASLLGFEARMERHTEIEYGILFPRAFYEEVDPEDEDHPVT